MMLFSDFDVALWHREPHISQGWHQWSLPLSLNNNRHAVIFSFPTCVRQAIFLEDAYFHVLWAVSITNDGFFLE